MIINDNIISAAFSYRTLMDYIETHNIQMVPGNYVNLYLDVKGTLGALYNKNVIENLDSNNIYDSLKICRNFLNFINSLREFIMNKYDNKLRVIMFSEEGTSSYHQNVDRKYKVNRKTKYNGLPDYLIDMKDNILAMNISILDAISNVIPDCIFLKSINLEGDFIPYYTLFNEDVRTNISLHIIRSDDKDLSQILFKFNSDKFIQIKRTSTIQNKNTNKVRVRNTVIMNRYNAPKYMTKYTENINYEPIYYKYIIEFLLAVSGDKGDDVIGVKGLGYKKVYTIYEYLLNLFLKLSSDFRLINDMFDKILDNCKDVFTLDEESNSFIIEFNGSIITIDKKNNSAKFNVLKKIYDDSELISKNYKLVSFDKLIEYHKNKYNFKDKLIDLDDKLEESIFDNDYDYYDMISVLDENNIKDIILTERLHSLYYMK